MHIKKEIKYMKKLFTAILVCILSVLSLSLMACNDNKNGTYYPKSDEMRTNLEKGGYTVTVTTDLADKNGTQLSATKDNEYIYFYWLDNAKDCGYFYNLLEKNHTNYNSLVKIENDEKFGNLVYCGTANAITVAGIKVVTVKV